MSIPTGLIIIKHCILRHISDQECIDALKENDLALPRKFVDIQLSEVTLSETKEPNYPMIANLQGRKFKEEILPLIQKNKGYKILYFGLAPIPLAIDLGSKFFNLYPVDIYQYHHKEQIWYQEIGASEDYKFDISTNNIPDKIIKGVENIILRVNASFRIDPEDTAVILGNAYDVEIGLNETNKDAFPSVEQFKKFVSAIENTLDRLAENFPKVKEIHLFAAIPTGIAFAVGNLMNPNIHQKIQTYNFKANDIPKYKKGLLIGESYGTQSLNLSAEEIAQCDSLRKMANTLLTGKMKTFLTIQEKNRVNSLWWCETKKVNKEKKNGSNYAFWNELPYIFETSLIKDNISLVEKIGFEGFTYRNNTWLLDDGFFHALHTRLNSNIKIEQAFRLFLFHEALHYKKHKLTTHTVEGIGNFPKVLEMTDYQADVYAILNNYKYEKHFDSTNPKEKELFLNSIDTALETMWSFDDQGVELREIQVRRVNRYLMWYWQYAAIDALETDDFDSIVAVLFEKPVIEINGLKIFERNNRVFYNLAEFQGLLEIAIFYKNEVTRDGATSNLKLRDLVQGLKTMNGATIKSVLKSFYDR
jgi:SMODS-associated and fused to various effectors sensor domain